MSQQIYQLGYADPISYTSFGASDIQLKKSKDGKTETVGLVQLVDIKRTISTGEIVGRFVFVLVEPNLLITPRQEDGDYFLFANNEYGQQAKFVLDNLVFTEEKWGITVDDIVMEISVSFTATNKEGWKPIK
jgi:hypothetical protein